MDFKILLKKPVIYFTSSLLIGFSASTLASFRLFNHMDRAIQFCNIMPVGKNKNVIDNAVIQSNDFSQDLHHLRDNSQTIVCTRTDVPCHKDAATCQVVSFKMHECLVEDNDYVCNITINPQNKIEITPYHNLQRRQRIDASEEKDG